MKIFPWSAPSAANVIAAILVSSATWGFASPAVIDDRKIIVGLQAAMEESVGKNGCPSADELRESATKADRQNAGIPLPETPPSSGTNGYDELSRSVYLVGSIYKCDKCTKWHAGSSATAWCLGEDGLMVTNAHVFVNAKGGAMAVSDRTGNCHPVKELVGIDVATDVAIFRVKASGLHPLRLAPAAQVGTPVTVISNPAGNYFLQTSGVVSRYSKAKSTAKDPNTTWMAITADFAKGSSGGPVFNAAGEVVGMVSSTRSIYTGQSSGKARQAPEGQLQMVIKNCVPVDAIRSLFEPVVPAETTDAR